jgi:hypothetical protein
VFKVAISHFWSPRSLGDGKAVRVPTFQKVMVPAASVENLKFCSSRSLLSVMVLTPSLNWKWAGVTLASTRLGASGHVNSSVAVTRIEVS